MKVKQSSIVKKQVKLKQKLAGSKSAASRLMRSTGVLKKNPSTETAHVEVMNRSDADITATILVFSWDSDSPVMIGETSVIVPVGSLRSFSTSLIDVFEHYEVVAILSSAANVIVNHFGIADNVPQLGNIVLDRDFISVDI
ncbi:hypothetical protein M3223_01730 [Paenibacillus pasadenensis]|uniref:hypothetical protein n=1 Tax=Paenibacillus pasadenensis TaxID=217090 RepID=UPI00203DED68|nr:hypothetical protein [Paenibacillus pasadenensis]MCM3746068.1 hypothetical protein [Paenibacillus pasadenensis]